MIPPDLYALAGAGLIGCGFFAGRYREKIFILAGAATLASTVVLVSVSRIHAVDAFLVCGGLFLFFFGLGIVRIMLHRSASLRMLDRFAAGRRETTAREDIARRFGDLEKFRLAVPEAGRYRLTRWGRIVGASVAILYGAMRIER